MNNQLYRIKKMVECDRMKDAEKLSDVIAREVSDRLSNFMSIKNCLCKIGCNKGGSIDVVIAIKADKIFV